MTCIELMDQRTEYSKTFRYHNGRHRVYFSSSPIHVRLFGRWEEVTTGYLEKGRLRIYLRLPYLLVTEGPNLEASERTDEPGWMVRTVLDHPAAQYRVTSPERVKTEILFEDLLETPEEVHLRIEYAGLSPVITEEDISFWKDGRLIWRLRRPVLVDAEGNWHPLPLKAAYPDPYGTIDLRFVLPSDWLRDPARAWPVLFDPTQYYWSDLLENGSQRTHVTPEDAFIMPGTTQGAFKGVSQWVQHQGSEQRQDTRTDGNSWGTSASYQQGETTINLNGGETFVSAWRSTSMTNQSGGTATNVYIKTPPDDMAVLHCTSVPNGNTCTRQRTNSASDLGTKMHSSTGPVGGWTFSMNASLTYTWTYYFEWWEEYKTYKPNVSANGKSAQYGGYINDGQWVGPYTLADGLVVSGSNTLTFNIEGSGKAYFGMRYDYKIFPNAKAFLKLKKGSGDPVLLPLVEVEDAALEFGSILRVRWADENGENEKTYAADLTTLENEDASGVRLHTHKGMVCWRQAII